MAMAISDIEAMIRAALPDAKVEVRDLAGDGDHYAATVVSPAFKGKSRVQQHQLVYAALQGPHGRRAARAGADDLGGVKPFRGAGLPRPPPLPHVRGHGGPR